MDAMTLLDSPIIWNASRIGLNLAFGLYRKRFGQMREWGLLTGEPSVLDIGCGIGQYASLSRGPYLGVDLNQRYIDFARRRSHGAKAQFRCIDVTNLLDDGSSFDLILMVDF